MLQRMSFSAVCARAPLLVAAIGGVVWGCSKDEAAKGADAQPPASSAPPTVASDAPPTASATPALRSDCPKGSSGPGTFDKPCEQKGAVRLMEATWTGKTDDKGPFFKITNKTSQVILYGRITVYFYDKAGKQLEVKDASGKG